MILVIDIAENKKLNNVSPFVALVFLFLFFVINIFLDFGIMYLIVSALSFGFSYMFFQYKPRYVVLAIKYMLVHEYLIPNYKDNKYYPNYKNVKAIQKILPEYNKNLEEDEE